MWIGLSSAIMLGFGWVRHAWFRSTGFDLGIYDQYAYLISQGTPPISSFLGFHLLGDHAAWAVYPLGILYRLWPDPRALLVVQALSLALGAVPTYALARQASLSPRASETIALGYLLYPLLFNLSIFDFHIEVLALPALLGAIWAARSRRVGWFAVAIAWVLGCKGVLSLTVIGLGIWLLVWEKRRACGGMALVFGIGWFVAVTQAILPAFSGEEAAAVARYSYLGDSVVEIILNLVRQPGLVLDRVFSGETLRYLFVLAMPLAWGLSPRHLAPLVAAVPTLLTNILSDVAAQRTLRHQYALPILPFLIVAVIATCADRGWLHSRRFRLAAIAWSCAALLVWGKFDRFADYARTLDTLEATRSAIVRIETDGGVLTDNWIAPHLTHRETVQLTGYPGYLPVDLDAIDYAVFNLRHPWPPTEQSDRDWVTRLQADPEFAIVYQHDDVYLFRRRD